MSQDAPVQLSRQSQQRGEHFLRNAFRHLHLRRRHEDVPTKGIFSNIEEQSGRGWKKRKSKRQVREPWARRTYSGDWLPSPYYIRCNERTIPPLCVFRQRRRSPDLRLIIVLSVCGKRNKSVQKNEKVLNFFLRIWI